MLTRVLVAIGFAIAGAAFFAVGSAATAAATEAEQPETGLLSLGTQAESLTDGLVNDVTAGSALAEAKQLPDIGLAGLGKADEAPERSAKRSATSNDERDDAAVIAAESDGAVESGGAAESAAASESDATDEPATLDDMLADGESTAPAGDGGLAESVAGPALAEADLLRELTGGQASKTGGQASKIRGTGPVTPLVEPVVEIVDTAAATVEPVVAAARPVIETAAGAAAPITHLIAPVHATLAPVTAVVVDTLTPVSEGLVPLGPLTSLTDELDVVPAVSQSTRVPASAAMQSSSAPAVNASDAILSSEYTAFEDSLDVVAPPAQVLLEGQWSSSAPTPLAGLPGSSVAVIGAAASADQPVPTSIAWLPEEAVQPARFVSAAAHASRVDGRAQREATKPSVSPD